MQGSAFVSSAHNPAGSKSAVWFTLLHVRAGGTGAEGVPSTQIKDVIKPEWVRRLGREESRAGQSSRNVVLLSVKSLHGHRTKCTSLFAKLLRHMTRSYSKSRKCSFSPKGSLAGAHKPRTIETLWKPVVSHSFNTHFWILANLSNINFRLFVITVKSKCDSVNRMFEISEVSPWKASTND